MVSKKDLGDSELKLESRYFVYGHLNGENIHFTTEVNESCAKEVINSTTSSSRYFIKRCPDGFVNPLNIDKRKDSFYKKRGLYKWCSVDKAGFEMYLQFLRTGKNQFLHQAERLF